MHTTEAMIENMKKDEQTHGPVVRLSSSSIWTVGAVHRDGYRNRHATPDAKPPGYIEVMNAALRAAFPGATHRLFR